MGASHWYKVNFNKNKVWNIRIRLVATGFYRYLNFLKLAHDAFCKQTVHLLNYHYYSFNFGAIHIAVGNLLGYSILKNCLLLTNDRRETRHFTSMVLWNKYINMLHVSSTFVRKKPLSSGLFHVISTVPEEIPFFREENQPWWWWWYICINAFDYNAIIVYFTVLKPGTLYETWYYPSYCT